MISSNIETFFLKQLFFEAKVYCCNGENSKKYLDTYQLQPTERTNQLDSNPTVTQEKGAQISQKNQKSKECTYSKIYFETYMEIEIRSREGTK